MLVQKYGVTPNTIRALTNLHINFVISCYGFQLYFTMVETKTADAVTERYMLKKRADWKICTITLESPTSMFQSPC